MTTYEPAWVVFTLDQVVPWGRSFDEYRRMFDLTVEDLGRTILGCGDGPACFNAEATRRGGRVVSCDPVYGFEKNQIQRRIATTYDLGKSAGRYVAAKLPVLPFPDATFDIALCSHFMLRYSIQPGEAFHRAAIREMCRVASDVRIFPLLALGGDRSPFVDNCVRDLRDAGHDVAIRKVPYEFQRGGNQMIRVGKPIWVRVSLGFYDHSHAV